MTASEQITKRKFSLLQLAEELGNVSKACQLMGYHRDSFYEIKHAFQTAGVAGLVEQKRGPRWSNSVNRRACRARSGPSSPSRCCRSRC